MACIKVKGPCCKRCRKDRIDVIIFGASGYAGKNAIREAVNVLKDFRWGVAGRSHRKLQSVLEEISTKKKINLKSIPIFVAQISDDNSLIAMAKRCRVVVNCCGPYLWYGEAVVKACIEAGTHHVDINFEPQYINTIQTKYDAEAKKKKVYIVSACGFPRMALDIGMNFIREHFEGTVRTVDAYIEFCDKGSNFFDPVASSAAWTSIVLTLADNKEFPAIQKNVFGQIYSAKKPRASSENGKGIPISFPLISSQVVNKSQDQSIPLQFNTYMVFPSVIFAALFFLWCFLIAFLAQFRVTRDLVIRHPNIFSLGLCSTQGPSEEKMEKLFFRITFYVSGWSKITGVKECLEGLKEKSLIAKVGGLCPLYGGDGVAMLTSALTILTESHKMPGSGGVFQPGEAFADTNIISQLENEEHGIVFDTVHQ